MYLIFLMVQNKNVAKRRNETIKKLRDIKLCLVNSRVYL